MQMDMGIGKERSIAVGGSANLTTTVGYHFQREAESRLRSSEVRFFRDTVTTALTYPHTTGARPSSTRIASAINSW